MKRVSKIVIFCLFLIISIVFTSSCEEEAKNPIPDISINLGPINIYDPEYAALLDVYGTYVFKGEGYLGNGIMVVNTGNNVYKAYDCTCTNEVKSGYRVRPTPNKIDNSNCNYCTSTFDLTYGSPLTGPAKYALKTYQVSFSNNLIRIYN